MSLNWDDLRIFLAVAREGNLSAAARSLRVTQPTVGRRLRALEQRLAARLFDRLSEGFVPTVAGAELLPLAEEMERSAEALERRQASLADTVSGTVRISVMEAMARFLAEFMLDLRGRLPEIEIELAFTHLGANLSKREADLLIREVHAGQPGLDRTQAGRPVLCHLWGDGTGRTESGDER
jgi:DNA-binding transcriptional LysR family regulator